MQLLWIILRYLFPRDPLRQGAEALRHRMVQLEHVANDAASLSQLLIDPALRRHLESIILDAEDCLRLWIAMRGCQIAKVRPKAPRRRATPHVAHARSLPDLLLRIAAFAAMYHAREKLAQAHAAKLKQLRESDPLGLGATSPHRHAATQRATSPAFQAEEENHRRLSSSKCEALGGGGSRALARETACRAEAQRRREGAATSTRGPPHSIAGATP